MKKQGIYNFWKFLFLFLLISIFINTEVFSQIDSSEVDEPIPEKIDKTKFIYLVDTIHMTESVLLRDFKYFDTGDNVKYIQLLISTNILNKNKDSISVYNFWELDSAYICIDRAQLVKMLRVTNNTKLYEQFLKNLNKDDINGFDINNSFEIKDGLYQYYFVKKPDYYYLFLFDISLFKPQIALFNNKIKFTRNCYVKVVSPHYSN